jgi:hypothetical protein
MSVELLPLPVMAKPGATTEQVSIRVKSDNLRWARSYAESLEFKPALGKVIDAALEMYLSAKGAPRPGDPHPPRAPRHKQP